MHSFLAVLFLAGSAAAATAASPAEVAARVDAALEAEWKRLNLSREGAGGRRDLLPHHLAGPGRPRAAAPEGARVPRQPRLRQAHRLVDTLLAEEDFADHWGRAWSGRLTGKRPVVDGTYDGRVLHEYLRDALRTNRPYRQVVGELISGEGLNESSGPANFLLRYECKPTDLAGAVHKHFLGVTLQVPAPSATITPMPTGKRRTSGESPPSLPASACCRGMGRPGSSSCEKGELQVPDTGARPAEDGSIPMKNVAPRLPVPDAPAVQGKRRLALAAWVTAEDNPYFARNAVNQVWAQLLGARSGGHSTGRPGRAGAWPSSCSRSWPTTSSPTARTSSTGAHPRPEPGLQVGAGGGEKAVAADEAKQEELRQQKTRVLARFRVRPLSVDQLYQSIAQATGHRGVEPPAAPAEEGDAEADGSDPAVNFLGERGQTVQRSLAC